MGTWTRSSYCDTGSCVEVVWGTSSYCDSNACIEVGWGKSSHCDSNGCVEVGHLEDEVLMRDSKDPDGLVLQFTREQWREFIEFIKN